ncbi:MAG: nucleotidyltransferase domain-containing protein [Spirochaetota bacterium]
MRKDPETSHILDLVKRFVQSESGKYHIDSAWLFGSWAYGDPHSESDVDVGLVLDQSYGFEDEVHIFADAQAFDPKLEPVVFAKDWFEKARASIVYDIRDRGIRIF